MVVPIRIRISKGCRIVKLSAAWIVVGHAVDVRRVAIAGLRPSSTAHIGIRKRPFGLVDLSVVIDHIRAGGESRAANPSTEHGSRIISDPAINDPEPPVALVEIVFDFEFMLGTAVYAEGKSSAGEDLGVDLHPPPTSWFQLRSCFLPMCNRLSCSR